MEQSGLRELVEFITKALVDDPGAVSVRQVDGERGTVIEVRVAPADMGKVIGKQGRIARALRAVVKAAAIRTGTRVMVEILQ
jgi:predicted RNA-binding protein YlqC (UPF0109 family)